MIENLIVDYLNTISQWAVSKNIKIVRYSWSSDNSAFCTFLYKEYSIYLEVFFVNDDEENLKDGTETVVNIFTNKICKYSCAGELENCIQKINSFIKI